MALNQKGRLIRMTKGPLGPDEVVVTGFSGREAISRLFSFQLEFISTDLDLKPGKIIGKDVSIELDRRDVHGGPLTPRHFHGYINRFAAGSVSYKEPGVHKYRQYRAEMVPWLWFLTQTARCYLFFPEKEDKTIYEVIEAVFARAKSDLHVDPVNDLKGINELKKRTVKHCVQYRETDFNFISRTMERYGVFYYFKFEDGKHTLVLDLKKNYPKCAEAEVFFPGVTGGQSAVDHITDWQHDYEFVSGKWSHTDYNFEKPSTALGVNAPKLPSIELAHNDKYEIYDYPGEYMVKGDGEADAKIRQEEEEVPHSVVNGASLCRTFTAGHKFKLTAHHDEDAVSEQGKSYVLTSVEHTASQPTDDTGDEGPELYQNRFTCIPDSVQYRPERLTPRPQISGVQTAVVVGPEAIHTDKYGRVKVQFHWDREGKKDGNSSCWIRVSQNWGGKNWGGMFIPHVGQEVIVDFLEGDPDQPIITGRVYNAEVMPPVDLPAGKTKSAIRDHGGNEIIMEGKDGVQQIAMFSPKSNTKLVMGDKSNPPAGFALTTDAHETKKIGINSDFTIGANEIGKIGANKTLLVGGNESKTIMRNSSESIAGKSSLKVGGKRSELIGGSHSIANPKMSTVTGGKHLVSAGSKYTATSPNVQLLAKSKFLAHSDGKMDVKATGKLTQQSGAVMNVKSGAALKVQSSAATSVKAGAALKMQSSAATSIKAGAAIKVDASAALNLKAGGDIKAKGATIKLNSPTKVKGTTLTVD